MTKRFLTPNVELDILVKDEAAKILTLDEVIVASHLIKSALEAAPEESQRIIKIVRGFFR